MLKFRLLETGLQSAARNMAIDEAVLAEIAEGRSPPTLRFYGWKPAAVSIGYFQSLEEELDLQACRKFGVEFVRRQTGGGAVLHEHEVTYSIHIPESLNLTPAGILESYGKICGGILKGLAKMGLQAQFIPLNDIILNGKKISGNAQTRKRGVILQHGTILLKVDVNKMFELLKVPDEKLKGKLITDIKQRVTSLSDALGREAKFAEIIQTLEAGFSEEFPEVQFGKDDLSGKEKMRIDELEKEKYSASTWNQRR